MLKKIKWLFKGDKRMSLKKFKGIYTPEEYAFMIEDFDNKIESCDVKKQGLLLQKTAFEAYYKKQLEFQKDFEIEEKGDDENE